MILHLNLKSKWFWRHIRDKYEEYRSITPYWCNRLLLYDGQVKSKAFWKDMLSINDVQGLKLLMATERIQPIRYHTIVFSNGMKPLDILPRFSRPYINIRIGKGVPEWGGICDNVFIIQCGKIFNKSNCD